MQEEPTDTSAAFDQEVLPELSPPLMYPHPMVYGLEFAEVRSRLGPDNDGLKVFKVDYYTRMHNCGFFYAGREFTRDPCGFAKVLFH